jgi:hypothetical protein
MVKLSGKTCPDLLRKKVGDLSLEFLGPLLFVSILNRAIRRVGVVTKCHLEPLNTFFI